MLYRAGSVQSAGPGGLLPLVAHDPEPQVISSLPDLPQSSARRATTTALSRGAFVCAPGSGHPHRFTDPLPLLEA